MFPYLFCIDEQKIIVLFSDGNRKLFSVRKSVLIYILDKRLGRNRDKRKSKREKERE